MRPKHKTYTIAAADADGICKTQTKAGAGALVLNGDLAGVLAIPRHISITPAANESLITFTITGTDRYDRALTETVTGGNVTLTKTTKCFKTVTGVSVSAALTGNVTVGSADSLETAWIPLDHYRQSYDAEAYISAGGSMDYEIEKTIGDVFEDYEWNMPIAEAVNIPTAIRLKVWDHVSGNLTLDIVTQRK